MAEEKKPATPEQKKQAEAPPAAAPAAPAAHGGSFMKIAIIVVVAVLVQTGAFVLWMRHSSGHASTEAEKEKPVAVEFGNFEVDKIYFQLPLTSGSSDVGLERQVAMTIVVPYDLKKEPEALKLLEAQRPWIRQEVRRVVRGVDDPVLLLKEDEGTMKALQEKLMENIRKRIGDEQAKILVGQEVIFATFVTSGV